MTKTPLLSGAVGLCVVLCLAMSSRETAASRADDDVRRVNVSDVTGVDHHNNGSANAKSEDQLTDEASRAFLRLLFDKYGERSAAADGGESATEAMTMTFEGFEHLLDSLGIGDVRIGDHGIEDHRRPLTDDGGETSRFRKLHEHDELGRHQQRPPRDPASDSDRNATGDAGAGVVETTEVGAKSDAHSHRRRRETNEMNNTQKRVDRRRSLSSNEKQDIKPLTGGAGRVKRESRLADTQQRSLVITDTVIVLPKCMSAMEILRTYHLHHYRRHSDQNHAADSADVPDYISREDFMAICPSIIYQLDERICQPDRNEQQTFVIPSSPCRGHADGGRGKCTESDDGVSSSSSGGGEQRVNTTAMTESDAEQLMVFGVSVKIWGFAFLSITVISLVGLATVAIIPLMGDRHQRCFDGLLQLLIALAVGTLTGDALLHLLPHALVPHDTDDAEHGSHGDDGADHDAQTVTMVMHGLAVLVGIYCFMFVERLLSICTRCRRRRHSDHVAPQNSKRPLAFSDVTQQVGHKLSSHEDKRLSTFIQANPENGTSADIRNRELVGLLDATNDGRAASTDCRVAAPTCDNDVRPGDVKEGTQVNDTNEVDTEAQSRRQRHKEVYVIADTAADADDDGHVHRHQHHGHSHGDVPSNVASVAWMVIMGDGLHNFTDGLAIGASFAGGGLAGGLGTTVAVFCHELPHELGDFAVLLNAGMSVRQALFYNLVSSVLSVIGMIVGVLIGNVGSASAWIFGLTAGIFVYISLVDMIPQMTKQHDDDDDEHQRTLATEFLYMFLHVVGIAGGLAIMTFIALFEDRIQWIAGGFGTTDDV